MALNFSFDLYRICQEAFAVPLTVHYHFSDPDKAAYLGRGIYDTRTLEVVAEDGSIFSDQQTIVDLRTAEFPILPKQKDRIDIPYDCNGVPLGLFEVVDSTLNGGGELTCIIRRFDPQAPIVGRRELKIDY